MHWKIETLFIQKKQKMDVSEKYAVQEEKLVEN